MTEKQTEMSLDEMLSSIRRMVIDKDPPVLELTDMISPDGSIVKVGSAQNSCSTRDEMRSFLRLAQKESDEALSKGTPSTSSDKVGVSESVEKSPTLSQSPSSPMFSEKIGIVISDVVREVATPFVEKWLEENLPSLVKEVVTAEIRKIVKQN